MLQSAIWKLGRKQRLLLPLARPLQSQSRTYNRFVPHPKRSLDEGNLATSRLNPWPWTVSATSEAKSTTPIYNISPSGDAEFFCMDSTYDSNDDPFAAKFATARRSHDSFTDAFQPKRPGHTARTGLCREPSRPSSRHAESNKPTDGEERSTWLESKLHQRPLEYKSRLSKSWANCGPEVLYHKVLYPGQDQYKWWERVASLRSYRLPVIILQMSIRQTILATHRDKRSILDLLPKGRERRYIIQILSGNGYSRDEISAFVHIIQGRSDHESCERFLKYPGHKPIFLLRHLLRYNSDLSDIFILHELIKYISTTYDGRRCWQREEVFPGPGKRDFPRTQNPMLNMSPALFGSTLGLLIQRCLEVDSRLCLHVVDIAIQYILNTRSWDQHPEKTFNEQCVIFNETLTALSPRKAMLGPKIYRSFPHVWEAQRKLLTMSAGLERPLLLNRSSFFAVRTVLAGQMKNHLECHSSSLHAQSWPPYLEPGDGMDETTDPEHNWSRSVQASALAQEAGFHNTELDDSLDILQGRAPDGTPTIQQRMSVIPTRLNPWVALIRATRNGQEAWGRFQTPPKKKMRPGVEEYGAVFTKLLQPDVRPELNLCPGDRPYSFPIRLDVNLSEFGRARLEPPTVSALYDRMLKEGIRPRQGCLNVLVWHSESVELAHGYLRDSGIDFSILTDSLIGDELDSSKLRKVHMPLFAAYINVLCRERPDSYSLEKAIFLCMKRFGVDHHNRWWAPRVWGMIMKAITRPWQRKERPLYEQLNLFNELLGFIQASTFLPLSSYLQFCKSLRKTVGAELDQTMSDLEAGRQSTLAMIYDSQAQDYSSLGSQEFGIKWRDRRTREKRDLHAINMGVVRMKQLFKDMVRREDGGRDILQVHDIDPLDQMLARRDPVRAEDAHEHLRTLAFVGEFDEMANVLAWLVREWSDPDLCEALYECEQIPSMADFTDVLCAFRLLAEPMLESERVDQLRQTIEQADAGWIWPDDEAVLWYRDMQVDDSTKKLAHVLEWLRYRQQRPGLEAEFDMQLEPPEKWAEPAKETPPHPRVWMGLRSRPANRYAF